MKKATRYSRRQKDSNRCEKESHRQDKMIAERETRILYAHMKR